MLNTRYYEFEGFSIEFLDGDFNADVSSARDFDSRSLANSVVYFAPVLASVIAMLFTVLVKGLTYYEEIALAGLASSIAFIAWILPMIWVNSSRAINLLLLGCSYLLVLFLLLSSFAGIANQGMALRYLKTNGTKINNFQQLPFSWSQQFLGNTLSSYIGIPQVQIEVTHKEDVPRRVVDDLASHSVWWLLHGGIDAELKNDIINRARPLGFLKGRANVTVETIDQLTDVQIRGLNSKGIFIEVQKLEAGISDIQAQYLTNDRWSYHYECYRFGPKDFQVLAKAWQANALNAMPLHLRLRFPRFDEESIAFLETNTLGVSIDERSNEIKNDNEFEIPTMSAAEWKDLLNSKITLWKVYLDHLDLEKAELFRKCARRLSIEAKTMDVASVAPLSKTSVFLLSIDHLSQDLVDAMNANPASYAISARKTDASFESLKMLLRSMPSSIHLQISNQSNLSVEVRQLLRQ